MKKKRGSLSVDFLIGMTVCCLLLVFVILTSLTFSLVETAQYVAYATAREYFIGHENDGERESRARDKYIDLKNTFFPSGKALSSWFCLSNDLAFGGYDVLERGNKRNFGAAFKFISHVMTMDIPFLGQTRDSTGPAMQDGCGGRQGGFVFPITALLGKESANANDCGGLKLDVSGGNGC